VIEQILPVAVRYAEMFDEPPGEPLFPEEAAVVARAVDKRRHEFAAGRLCARRALGQLGLAAAPLLPGPKGEPRWPAGIAGAITHCAGFAAAAVARTSAFATIGVDAEPHGPLPDGVVDLVSIPAERARLRTLAEARPDVCWDRLLFSAKESVYKAWFPLAGRWLGFEDADITISPVDQTFHARLLVAGPMLAQRELTDFAGRWLTSDAFVLTAIAVPAA